MGTCNVCGAEATEFAALLNLPIYCNLLWDDRQAAIDCPKGDIRLAFCSNCGGISNTVFDPYRLGYSQDYENSLHYSPRFQQYATNLAQRLVKKHDLHRKTIVEIGCGKGDFLVSLCELGDNKGIGFDNSYVERDEHLNRHVTFIQDFYSEKYAHYRADFVCCRQVLEHVQRPNDLLLPLKKALGEGTAFFEVPNALYTFENMMVWDIIYEHCTYFTPVSLAYTFAVAGFETSEVREEFAGQFMSIEGVRCDGERRAIADSTAVQSLHQTIETFASRFAQQQSQWRSSLEAMFSAGKKVVIWGSGSKGVTFLNLLKLKKIHYAVDINPRKQGKYIPGGGQAIVAPEQMRDYRPDVVIVMNPLYKQEIEQSLIALGLGAQVMTTAEVSN